ncbi:hypothetical protein O181_077490 [Austropuccinia psidii MF-1]|uniref:Uncharacterized protein n=1 Tax=Austropuccinia psidii MF-1 TaxID=1389203 RepID=A0A9Q3IG12_9BASI|nr:hypothetical protein [Austropuccinia psidii MF-1]
MVQHSFFKLLSLLTLITDFPTSLAWKRPHHHPGHYDRHQRASSNAPPSRTKISSPTTLQDNQLGMSQALEGLSSLGIPSDTVKVGKLALGFLPDDGTTGGERQNMQEIMHALHEKQIGIYGFYAQVNNGELFNGYQFKWIMDDLRKSKAVFNPAVMPPKDWSGLTYQDNRQAVAM